MIKPLIGIGADVATSGPHERERAFTYLTYANAVRDAGAIPVLIPPQPENAHHLVRGLDGLLLAGGGDCDPSLYGEEKHPRTETMDARRQENDVALADAARKNQIPTLGICLGVQLMSVAAGGSLVQDIDSQLDTSIRHASPPSKRARHDVEILSGTRLASILPPGTVNVNSSHHQSVRTAGEGLTITARAGDGVIEGIEDPKHPFYVGVQWHPEDMPGENSATALFSAFVRAAQTHAEARRRDETANAVTHSE